MQQKERARIEVLELAVISQSIVLLDLLISYLSSKSKYITHLPIILITIKSLLILPSALIKSSGNYCGQDSNNNFCLNWENKIDICPVMFCRKDYFSSKKIFF